MISSSKIFIALYFLGSTLSTAVVRSFDITHSQHCHRLVPQQQKQQPKTSVGTKNTNGNHDRVSRKSLSFQSLPPLPCSSSTLLHMTTSPSSSLVQAQPNTNNYVQFKYSQNTTVILLGCIHGSTSSANDVREVLDGTTTNVVVLELCPGRYRNLQRSRQREKPTTAADTGRGFVTMITKNIQARGLATGIASAILTGASNLQSSLSGFEPGLEFTTAMDYVSNNNNKCDVILADQTVEETFQRVGSLPLTSWLLWKEFWKNGEWNWNDTYGTLTEKLSSAIWGDQDWMRLKQQQNKDESINLQIDIGKSFYRNKQVILDLLRLTVPFFLLVESTSAVLNASMAYLLMLDNTISVAEELSAFDLSMQIITSAVFVFLGYLAVLLPMVQLILSERDNQLARGVDAACKIAAEKDKNGGRVVAVMGLLHLNGVAKELLADDCIV